MMKVVERTAFMQSSRRPFLTTTLSAIAKSIIRSRSVRLQTNNGRPVSLVDHSHSSFGLWKPGAQAASVPRGDQALDPTRSTLIFRWTPVTSLSGLLTNRELWS